MLRSLIKYLLLTAIISRSGGFPLFAQEVQPWAGFGIEANVIAAKVIKHEPKFTLPLPSVTTGFDVDLLLHTYGKKEWEQRRRYPTIGLGLCYINYGIDSIYGRTFGLYPNITIPLASGKNLEWDLRLGDGVGYVTTTYRRVSPVDTINVAIGSHINDFAMVMTDVRHHINQHWDIQAGAQMNHISDASYHKPNLGINTVGIHLGVRYSPATSRPVHILRHLAPLPNRWLVQARTGLAMVSSYTPGGPLYPVYIASAYVSRRWLSKNKMFAGVDYSYHENIYAYLRNNGIDVGQERNNSYKSALFGGNEFLIGRVGIFLQAGAYLKQAYIRMDPIYEKIGGNYYFVLKEHGAVKEFFLYAAVKTDLSVAEFGEVGFGLGIK